MTDQRPVAWARFYPNGGPESVYLDRPPVDAEPLYRSPTTNTTPGQGSLQARCMLTDENERLRSSMAERQFCKLPVAGSSPAVGSLTDEERAAIGEMLHLIATKHEDYGREAHYLRTLLERMTVAKPMPIEISAEVSSHPISDRIYVSSTDSND
jgi:hypothetical protein